jgi:N-acetylneuraminate synthase
MMTEQRTISIGGRPIGKGQPVFVIAEVSANHRQSYQAAVEIIQAAKAAGADAIKLQTYTADTLTLNCRTEPFRIKGTLWDDRYLYDLYQEAYTPWEWQPRLKQVADDLGLICFSSPFDVSAVEFLESLGVPAYKVASFECTDQILLKAVAKTGKPVIMSTGMASLSEMDEAVTALRAHGASEIILLKCTSAYPSLPSDMNLATIPHLSTAFGVPVGLSDHTLGHAVAVAAVALGACVIEKHLTLRRSDGGPDGAFSMEPAEFKAMIADIRVAEQAVGHVHYGLSSQESASRALRRSLFVAEDVREGELFTRQNVRSVRPAAGLHTRHLEDVIGHRATRDLSRGKPLGWDMVGSSVEAVTVGPATPGADLP